MRITASIVLVAFTMLIFTPTVVAARAEYGRSILAAMHEPSDEARFTELVQQIEDQLVAWKDKVSNGQSGYAESNALNGFRTKLDLEAEIILGKFSDQRQQIIDKGLPDVILQRHDDSVARFQSRLDQLRRYMDSILEAPDADTLEKSLKGATEWLESQQKKRSQQPFDPNNLPNKSRKVNPHNKPREFREEFFQSGLFNSPMPKLAVLGDFTFDNLAGANDPAYLVETDEVNLNQFIQDKAAELNHDPVKIYHWVRNNVEWLPSWGAVQDAELTLSAKRGNAFDIASLTIALLRASGIPARYVHGTIDVPLEEFKNWAGGFDTAEAAANFAASGGIPAVLFTTVGPDGETQTIRMEHVWVEAAIDYVPSRGARNFDADQWIEMDPSYKQYEYFTGLDAVQISGIDTDSISQQFISSGIVNDQEQWVTGFNPNIMGSVQDQIKTQVKDYIDNNLSTGSIGDVIGDERVILKEYPVLPGSMPYQIIVKGVRYGQIPSSLQQKIAFAFGRDIFGDPLSPITLR